MDFVGGLHKCGNSVTRESDARSPFSDTIIRSLKAAPDKGHDAKPPESKNPLDELEAAAIKQ